MLHCAGIGEGAMSWPAGLYAGRLRLDWQPTSSGPDVSFEAYLETFTARGRGYKSMPVGIYTAVGCKWAGLGPDELRQCIADGEKRARSELRLEKGLRILGRSIGRLSGHLK